MIDSGNKKGHRYKPYNFPELFRQYLLAEKKSASTIKNYVSDLRHFWGFVISYKPKTNIDQDSLQLLKNIDNLLIIYYRNRLTEDKVPEITIKRRISSLRNFFSFCVKQGWLINNPDKQIRMSSNTAESTIENYDMELLNPNLIDKFHNSLKKEGLSERTINNYIADISEFISVINSDKAPNHY